MLESVDVPEDKATDALVSLDKLDKIGKEKVITEMIGRGIRGGGC